MERVIVQMHGRPILHDVVVSRDSQSHVTMSLNHQNSTADDGAGMLHLCELQVFCRICVVEREKGCGKFGLLLRPHFPALDATCPACARWAQRVEAELRSHSAERTDETAGPGQDQDPSKETIVVEVEAKVAGG